MSDKTAGVSTQNAPINPVTGEPKAQNARVSKPGKTQAAKHFTSQTGTQDGFDIISNTAGKKSAGRTKDPARRKVEKSFNDASGSKQGFDIISHGEKPKEEPRKSSKVKKVSSDKEEAGKVPHSDHGYDMITNKPRASGGRKLAKKGAVRKAEAAKHKDLDPITGKPKKKVAARNSTGAFVSEIKSQGSGHDLITGKAKKEAPKRSTSKGSFAIQSNKTNSSVNPITGEKVAQRKPKVSSSGSTNSFASGSADLGGFNIITNN